MKIETLTGTMMAIRLSFGFTELSQHNDVQAICQHIMGKLQSGSYVGDIMMNDRWMMFQTETNFVIMIHRIEDYNLVADQLMARQAA